MPSEHPIFAEISALLDERAKVALAELEHTLTTGYAAALEFEAERWRLERRIAQVASDIGESAGRGHTRELTRLARRLKRADTDLVRLRALLSVLRERTAAARAA